MFEPRKGINVEEVISLNFVQPTQIGFLPRLKKSRGLNQESRPKREVFEVALGGIDVLFATS